MQYFFVTSLLVASVTALPLNINLGAYSPALVVGDGEISFGGKADVTSLMNALEGAAVSGAAANGAAGTAAAAPAAAAPAAVAVAQPAVAPETAITSLQGMGKEIAPRIVKLERYNLKRDLSGFNAALKFASDALKSSPEVQLGTEAAGVGILVSAGGSGAAATPPKAATTTAATAKPAMKRDSPRMKTTVTTMFVRGSPAPANAARSTSNKEKRAPSPVLDGVNFNMAEGQVAELTFVETTKADDDEE